MIDAAYVSACVRIEKYTPLMRERKARKPKTYASSPGTRNTIVRANGKLENGSQKAGKRSQPRNTRKSGMGFLYCPSSPIIRIRYMPCM